MRLFTIQEVDKFFEEDKELELEPEILPGISWGLSRSGWFLLPPSLSDMFFLQCFTCCGCYPPSGFFFCFFCISYLKYFSLPACNLHVPLQMIKQSWLKILLLMVSSISTHLWTTIRLCLS
jgi:hypothetical protein